MRPLYRRTQFGSAMLIFCAAVVVFVLLLCRLTSAPVWMSAGIVGLLALVAVPFMTLTIRVTSDAVEWWLLFGLMHRRLPLDEIGSTTTMRTSLLNGLGIRIGTNAELWMVAGFRAIKLTLKDGRFVALGTPEPERLIAIIDGATKPRQAQAG